IMAAGTLIQGSSIEISADGTNRPPKEAYVQGVLSTVENTSDAADELLKVNISVDAVTLKKTDAAGGGRGGGG
ncbi:methionine gamma-lyase family protein, partial [Staphylococcus aureus]|uniref:methionine gamma-lyase family protein n=1 Tax=Staphylococcus aureus TaxID=1280 RepID=UPI003F97CCFB